MFIKVLFTNSQSLSIKFTVNVKFCKCGITLKSYNIFISQIKGIHDSDPVSSQLSSVACAYLLSLVVGLGNTSKICCQPFPSC